MKTLITGANGFVGSAVLRVLLDEGHNMRVLVRKNSDRRNLDKLPVEICEGDLTDRESLKQAISGCDFLFHVAADYRLWIPRPDVMYKTNVDGTHDLMQEAAAAGVKKIIYTSSVATLGLNKDGTPADENTDVSLEDMIGHYKRSKFLAEQAVQNLIKSTALPAIIVNPSTPIGPRDIKPTPTGRIIVDMLKGRMPAYVNTGLNLVHVDDVARGHLLAFKKGRTGQRYILGGENMSLKSILTVIAEIAGISPPRFQIPHNAVLPIAFISEQLAKLTRREPLATIDGVNMAKKLMYFSSSKAETELGYQHGNVRDAIESAIAWFRDNGYV